MVGENSLIQATVERLAPVIPPERMWVLTNEHLRDTIAKQLPGVPKRQILAEPAQRNTAPAIGLAAHVMRAADPDAVMGVFPSDHVIGKPVVYRTLVKQAMKSAADRAHLMVAGIPAALARDRLRIRGVSARREGGRARDGEAVPRKARSAKGEALCSGRQFLLEFRHVLLALRCAARTVAPTPCRRRPRSWRRCRGSVRAVSRKGWRRRFRCARTSRSISRCSKKRKNVSGIPAPDFGWNDVGSWNAVYELLARDACGNVMARDSVCLDSHNNFVDARGKMVALLGVKDLIVVDTPDALLVATRDRAQQVGDVVKALERAKREDLL